MSEIINHEEAYLLACLKQSESNLARCYLDMKEQRDELLEALEESLGFLEFAYTDIQMNDYSFNLLEETTNKVRAAITKAKGIISDNS